jgi:FolB domain-containing protein
MTDIMHIKNLVVSGKHGVYPEEKLREQRFQIDLELQFDFSKAQASDNVEDTYDWSRIRDEVSDIVKNNTFNLIERLVNEIVTALLKHYAFSSVKVTVIKLDAWGGNGTPGITIERTA